MSTKIEDSRIFDITKYSEYSDGLKPKQLALFEEELACLENEKEEGLLTKDDSPQITDTFMGNRACLKPDSLMRTQRVEGGFIYFKREDLYD